MDLRLDEIDEVIKDKAIILFYADWCPYCLAFKPIFESYKINYYKTFNVKINEDDNPLWERFNIMTIPTVIAFNNNKIVARRDAKPAYGLRKDDMESLIKELSN
jgi:thioredoxin-like negative regulator of GroEL